MLIRFHGRPPAPGPHRLFQRGLKLFFHYFFPLTFCIDSAPREKLAKPQISRGPRPPKWLALVTRAHEASLFLLSFLSDECMDLVVLCFLFVVHLSSHLRARYRPV